MPSPVSNLLLDRLSADTRAQLLRRCQSVSLPSGMHLGRPGEPSPFMYFLTSGICSVVTELANGETVEAGLMGREGLLPTLQLLGSGADIQTSSLMQVSGTGLRMDFRAFEQEFQATEAINRLVLRYVQYQSLSLSQLTACNRVHEVEERMSRWLLMVADRTGEMEMSLTQEFLATMLGTRRSTVSIVAGTLQRSGLIQYQRGRVTILDRDGLQNSACECYAVMRRLLDSLYQ